MFANMRTFRFPIPGGDLGTWLVLQSMRIMARFGAADPLVRELALEITEGIPGRAGTDQALAIRDFLEENVDFTRDPSGQQELLYTPNRMARILTERGPPLRIDCDDVATLAAALGGAIGLKSRFVVVGFLSPNAPFRHVWTELSGPGRHPEWVQQDVTRSQQPLPMQRAVSRRWTVGVT